MRTHFLGEWGVCTCVGVDDFSAFSSIHHDPAALTAPPATISGDTRAAHGELVPKPEHDPVLPDLAPTITKTPMGKPKKKPGRPRFYRDDGPYLDSALHNLLETKRELKNQAFHLKNEPFRHANCGCPLIAGYLAGAAEKANASLLSPLGQRQRQQSQVPHIWGMGAMGAIGGGGLGTHGE